MSIFVNKHQLNFQVNVLYLITNIICKADINYIFKRLLLITHLIFFITQISFPIFIDNCY